MLLLNILEIVNAIKNIGNIEVQFYISPFSYIIAC